MTYGSVQRATKRLKLHPHRVQVCHELKEIDKDMTMVSTIYTKWCRYLGECAFSISPGSI
jgi:hypothetical protein